MKEEKVKVIKVIDVNVVITRAESNQGNKTTTWCNDAKIKINGVATDVMLSTISKTKPSYEFGQRVSCSLVLKENGERYFTTAFVEDSELDSVTL